MDTNPYAPCTCGSGKQFKWCCQPIDRQISQVFQLDEEGQHEAAITLMEEVLRQHPGNPQAHGRKALLLYQNQRAEEAEQALDEAFRINPDYAFGFFLKAQFRLHEGEIAGGLILMRKAAELYSPEAHDILVNVQATILDCEMKLNRPIAAYAAGELALKHNPAEEQLRKGLAQMFGPESPTLPSIACEKHEYKPLPPSASAERSGEWAKALATAATGKLAHAEQAFAQLVSQQDSDPAAWYNLGLTRAWLGRNADALEAFDRYVALEPNEAEAARAWALAEVLRVGQGMEDQADYVEYVYAAQLHDPQVFGMALTGLDREKLLMGVQVNEEQGVLGATVLDPPPPALTPELEAKQSSGVGGHLLLVGNVFRLWHINKDVLHRTFANVKKHAGAALGNHVEMRGPAKFVDVPSEALRFPRVTLTEENVSTLVGEGIAHFYEEEWLHRPLKSLGGVPPIDAAGHGMLRKKLLGVVEFVAECAALSKYPYDFDRLRRKLGLLEGKAAVTGPAAAATDLAALSAAELAALAPEGLDDGQLEQAFRAALKLDARELAGQFARVAVARPPSADRPDRYPLFNHLVQLAVGNGDTAAALDEVNTGEAHDCTHNEGRRRNDYELRRAQIHIKRGEHDLGQDAFDRLIARSPSELKFQAGAAEAMLSARQGPRALRYAEAGLAEARKQQNRDLEGHFQELVEASKRPG
jgi:tetratricopeptide (TPR) repeat protein